MLYTAAFFFLAFGIFYVFFKLGYYVQPRTKLTVLGEIISMMIIIGTTTMVIGLLIKASGSCSPISSKLLFVGFACGAFSSGASTLTNGILTESPYLLFWGWFFVAIGLLQLFFAFSSWSSSLDMLDVLF
jgi:hypothetical protein